MEQPPKSDLTPQEVLQHSKHPLPAGVAIILMILGWAGQLICALDPTLDRFICEIAWGLLLSGVATAQLTVLTFETRGLIWLAFGCLAILMIIDGSVGSFSRSLDALWLSSPILLYGLRCSVPHLITTKHNK